MATEPEPEYLPANADLDALFVACDVISGGASGAVLYRAFRNGHFYVVIDARGAGSRIAATLTGLSRPVVALRFGSRQARETWITLTQHSAAVGALAAQNVGSKAGGGSGGGGAPVQPALSLPTIQGKKRFDA